MSKLIDLTNQRFGRLLVLKRSSINKSGRPAWDCLCDCGKTVSVRACSLRDGNTTSCGCYKIENTKKIKTKNISDQQFGLLTVIKETEERTHDGRIVVLCRCECGTEIKVVKDRLTTGNTKSCGCSKSIRESVIAKILEENDISFKREYSVKGFVYDNGSRPRFDFAIFNKDGGLSHLIEHDGIQHFKATGYGWNTEENLASLQYRDSQKDSYCKENDIRLIRIRYDEEINISKLL